MLALLLRFAADQSKAKRRSQARRVCPSMAGDRLITCCLCHHSSVLPLCTADIYVLTLLAQGFVADKYLKPSGLTCSILDDPEWPSKHAEAGEQAYLPDCSRHEWLAQCTCIYFCICGHAVPLVVSGHTERTANGYGNGREVPSLKSCLFYLFFSEILFRKVSQVCYLFSSVEIQQPVFVAVAAAIMQWGKDHKATNFTHWFQPLGSTGVRHGMSGQVHNNMFTFGKDGKPLYKFGSKFLSVPK